MNTRQEYIFAVRLKNLSPNFKTVDDNLLPDIQREPLVISFDIDIVIFPQKTEIPLREITAGCFCYTMFYSAQSKK